MTETQVIQGSYMVSSTRCPVQFLSQGNEVRAEKQPRRVDVLYNRMVRNWVKFHILIYLSPLHKCPMKEGFLTSWGVKSRKKPCRQNHRLAMVIFCCQGKPIVWFNLLISTSTCGLTFLFGTFMQKTRPDTRLP